MYNYHNQHLKSGITEDMQGIKIKIYFNSMTNSKKSRLDFILTLRQNYICCGETMFKSCVQDVNGRRAIIFGCTNLIQLVLDKNVQEIHVDATF
ncbi:MULE domain-containing protein [Aphis craccivora]|uniref:MULE domain-containing protein n=1 Tax=Aphis craccivora TaxID=307492 RepID=A0A6G0YB22_APHCR|nr:MULE domain-containing protein [Aphis craccivora]